MISHYWRQEAKRRPIIWQEKEAKEREREETCPPGFCLCSLSLSLSLSRLHSVARVLFAAWPGDAQWALIMTFVPSTDASGHLKFWGLESHSKKKKQNPLYRVGITWMDGCIHQHNLNALEWIINTSRLKLRPVNVRVALSLSLSLFLLFAVHPKEPTHEGSTVHGLIDKTHLMCSSRASNPHSQFHRLGCNKEQSAREEKEKERERIYFQLIFEQINHTQGDRLPGQFAHLPVLHTSTFPLFGWDSSHWSDSTCVRLLLYLASFTCKCSVTFDFSFSPYRFNHLNSIRIHKWTLDERRVKSSSSTPCKMWQSEVPSEQIATSNE